MVTRGAAVVAAVVTDEWLLSLSCSPDEWLLSLSWSPDE
jgi:hypothetical protein